MSTKRFRSLVVAGAALGTLSLGGTALAADAPGKADIEIAIDTTYTMGPSIAQAKEDARRIVSDLRALYPDARFAVAEFRDQNYDDPSPDGPDDADEHDYVLRTGMTADPAVFQAALDKVVAAPLAPGETPGWKAPAFAAESYNLMFNKSYTDTTVGWRADARKFVVVIGDSEPYNAQGEGFDGCDSRDPDPYGLSTKAELAAMRANERTLLMVLQTKEIPAASRDRVLRCYSALAAAAFQGGGAGTTQPGAGTPGAPVSVGRPIVDLVKQALASVSQRVDRKAYAAGGTARFTVTFRNRNDYAVRLASVVATLPKGAFAYVKGSSVGVSRKNPAKAGRQLTWKVGKAVAANGTVTLHFRVKLPARAGTYRTTVRTVATLATGATITSTLKTATKIVVRRGGR